METLKNFLTGLAAVILTLILLGLIFLTWPLLVGLSSVVLFLAAFAGFVILVFYIIVLIGYLTRTFVFRKDAKDAGDTGAHETQS